MANVGPFTWYVRDNAPTSTVGWSAVTAWATGATIAAGALRRQLATPAVNSERVFVCVVAGTTHATTEPTWVLTKGAKTTDNTVTWQECTGQPGVNGDLTSCPTWLQNKNTAVTIGMIICNAAQTFLFICTTAGTTGNGAEPTWNTTAGVTTADNTVTWTSLGAVGGFAAWAAPHARLQNVFAATWGGAQAGSRFFVADDHAETQASAFALTIGTAANPCYVYCVDHTVAVPPGSANLKTTAAITNSAAVNPTIGGYVYYYGLKISTGANLFSVSSASFNMTLETCQLILTDTSATAYQFQLGTGVAQSEIMTLINTQLSFASVNQGIQLNDMTLIWKNTASALIGAAVPTVLFPAGGIASICVIDGVDLSAAGSGKTLVGSLVPNTRFSFVNCKLGASVTVAATPPAQGAVQTDVINSDSAATSYQVQRYRYEGTLTTETAVVRTGGASNGTTPMSFKVVTTANSKWLWPFECVPIGIWNATTGANVTCTICGIWAGAALPNNDQIWADIEYLGSASSPLASFATGTKANNLATGAALAADTSAWDSQATARANTTAYVLGQTIKLASNPGRLFFCTTAGTSAGSEPGGYASAVDGGSVTDNTAIFQAGFRFKLVVVLSAPKPQLAGDLYAIVRAALPSSTFWIDPLITLT